MFGNYLLLGDDLKSEEDFLESFVEALKAQRRDYEFLYFPHSPGISLRAHVAEDFEPIWLTVFRDPDYRRAIPTARFCAVIALSATVLIPGVVNLPKIKAVERDPHSVVNELRSLQMAFGRRPPKRGLLGFILELLQTFLDFLIGS